MPVYAIILAAGEGRRMGAGRPKQLLELMGRPVLAHALAAFDDAGSIDAVVLVAPPGAVEDYQRSVVAAYGIRKVRDVVPGGAERQDSVREGLKAVADDAEAVAIHDAARPLIRPEEIDAVVAEARASGAAVLGTPVTDTVKEVADGEVRRTLDRSVLWAVQTPQAFRADVIREAHLKAEQNGFLGTDDTVLVERLGRPVKVVPGRADNLKITTPGDLPVAEQILQRRRHTGEAEIRTGLGYDVHRLTEGRPLILGGVTVPFERGLEGHSDADVLAHAVTDAILGAVNQGDIGRHFPDSDPAYKGSSSMTLLERATDAVRKADGEVVNVDATVMAQRPKLAPHIPEMQARLAAAMGIAPERVSVKATTTERLGFVGREEGMAAQAVASVRHRKPGVRSQEPGAGRNCS